MLPANEDLEEWLAVSKLSARFHLNFIFGHEREVDCAFCDTNDTLMIR